MNESVRQALRVETEFLAGVESNLDRARGRLLPGSSFKTARQDEVDRLRRIMLDQQVYDRQRMAKLPHNRRIVQHGFDRRWWFLPSPLARWGALRKRTAVAVASVLTPLAHYVAADEGYESSAPPIGAVELLNHVRALVTDPDVPHLIGVCSPTGFTDDAKRASLDLPNITLVLTEPREDGGWTTTAIGEGVPEPVRQLFDPEDASQKIRRAEEEVERRRADLLAGGVSADSVARELSIPVEMAAEALRRKAISEPELRISSRSGTMVLYHGGPVAMQEKSKKSLLDRVLQLFGKEGDESEKIAMFSEQRAHLAQRRDRLYNEIGKLEEREADLLDKGRKNPSKVVRRRLAAQLAQVRKDIARQNTTANMLNQQINIISTRVHNLTLIQQGQMAQMPSAEELAEEAVRAEEMLEQLKADADLVGSLETGLSEALSDQEELDILKEFEEPEPAAPAKAAPQVETRTAAEPPAATSPPIPAQPDSLRTEPLGEETQGPDQKEAEPD
jgi:hypothetical protein